MNWTAEGLIRLVEVILAGGIGLVLRDVAQSYLRKKDRAEPQTQRGSEQALVEKAMLNLKTSNDGMSTDNTRLRTIIATYESNGRAREEWWQLRWDAREERWTAREHEMQEEIDSMRQRMVGLIRELDEMRIRLEKTKVAD